MPFVIRTLERMEHMTEKEYTEVLRGVGQLFRQYSKNYYAESQKKYYQKVREARLEKMKERYATDEAYREKMKGAVKEWTWLYKK